MSVQSRTFAVAVAAVSILILLVLQAPSPAATPVITGGGRGNEANQQSSSVGPMPADSPVVEPHGSWSHGISFDTFKTLVQRHAASVALPGSTPVSRSSMSTATSVPDSQPVVPKSQDLLPAADPMRTTLGINVPVDVRRWEPSILKYARQNRIDPNLVAAMMMTESQGNPGALSSRGAVGLMQVVDGPSDPEANISAGATIIASNLQRYSGNVELSLAAYNAGAGAVDQFRGVPPYLETETYVYLVLNRYYLYQINGS